ncbi:M56 family metallopeptidase [Infirmifilum lucidum]|uniref:M56 family metallopeptidase n=1 Tax=Infirmifilum lucidum TaxID=2776706 RepID=A0A7L9FF75_9CREN|nr:M56 family metallopeptidase [Infirmifilum lucidum]QOJ78281.1 M56 family metallopeptidase [Infirmifilum lucidum]
MKRIGYTPERVYENEFLVKKQEAEISVKYIGGVVQACASDDQAVRDFARELANYASSACNASPEVVLLLTDGKQLDTNPDVFGEALFQRLRSYSLAFFVAVTMFLPVILSTLGFRDVLGVSVTTILFTFLILLLAPVLYSRFNCLEVPTCCKRVFLLRIAVDEIKREDILSLAVAKHILAKKNKPLMLNDAERVLRDVGVEPRDIRLKEVDLDSILSRLSRKYGFRVNVCITPSPRRNAYTLGLFRMVSRVYVTAGLLLDSSPRELEAILAHELAHLKHRDSFKLFTAASVECAARAFLLSVFQPPLILLAGYSILLFFLFSKLLQHMELEADAEASRATSVEDFVSALVRFEYPELVKSGSRVEKRFAATFSAHPPASVRIWALLSRSRAYRGGEIQR